VIHVAIDPLDMPDRWPSEAWPAWLASKLREAGARLDPLPTIAPTAAQVQDALQPPWSAWWDRIDMKLHIAQGDAVTPAQNTEAK
jgi:hypothetical protein